MASSTDDGYAPLFETKRAKGRFIYRLFAVSLFAGICLIWIYRFIHMPQQGEDGRWVWIGLLGAELWFGFYWIITQGSRWNQVTRFTFKDKLCQRYENELPSVDIFVCTADPAIEPPKMVINTVLSVMAYDYPTEKLSVYLSDDGGSDLTFYALLEASQFARHWLPYCKQFKLEPRSPAAYFASLSSDPPDLIQPKDFMAIKRLYQEMEKRIDDIVKLGRVPSEVRSKYKGFSKWETHVSPRDHDSVVDIVIDGRDPTARDTDGCVLPTLVYLAREKRPQYHHNFKAGAMNALIRVSSIISNGKVILNVDCDMYSNNSSAVRDAICFFVDEKESNKIAFIQFPQSFANVTTNDLYGNSLLVLSAVDLQGFDGYGGSLYIGSGCFHRRDILCGRLFSNKVKYEWKTGNNLNRKERKHDLEQTSNSLANCTYEQNTQWGKEMGLKYGCPVEDVITGLSIQCRGWKSVYYNPTRKAFLGVAPLTLSQALVQHKRWAEGNFSIFLSKYNPALYGFGKISPGLQMGYSIYGLWAPNCLPTLYYSLAPSLYLLRDIPLFPKISSPWFLAFAYVVLGTYGYSLAEYLFCGGTVKGWWNEQRMWLYRRVSSYLFAFIDTITKSLGFSSLGFVITAKVADEDVMHRYNEEIMEFGTSTPMFMILSSLALINLFCFVGFVKKVVTASEIIRFRIYEEMILQVTLCGVLVLINLPLYKGLFLRKDKGKMPTTLTLKSIVFTLAVYVSFALAY